jgi:hypothetical protein
MTRKVGKVALILTTVILLSVGYMINFTAMLVRVGASQEIYLLFFMLGYAVVYLSCWLIVLFIAYKRNSNKLFNLFFIFWLITAACFVSFEFIESTFFSLFGFLLFIPLAGFDALRFYASNGFLYAQDMNAALMISIIMLLLGLVTKRKRTV